MQAVSSAPLNKSLEVYDSGALVIIGFAGGAIALVVAAWWQHAR
jgi:hypothetical protein